MAFEMRLLEDTLPAGTAFHLPDDGVQRVIYVVHGTATISHQTFRDDTAWHGCAATIVAGEEGVALWRYELVPPGKTAVLASPGQSLEKLRRVLQHWPIADELLMRCDSVGFPPGGCAFLHTHQGPGIRCLIEGGIRIDTEGRSTSYGPGGAWFEGGPEPVFAQAAADRTSRFVRVMVLPRRLLGASSIRYERDEDRAKPKSQQYKGYVDAPIEIEMSGR